LGVFSEDVRALASITNKVCEAAASRKAIVTENSPAIRECFAHGENIHTVEPGSSEMLATALVNLYEQPEYLEILEDGSLLVHERQFSVGVIAEILRKRINLI
jgi:glycosyltransferase involved in cell wall biosynthesis